jgi:hypothetical protein
MYDTITLVLWQRVLQCAVVVWDEVKQCKQQYNNTTIMYNNVQQCTTIQESIKNETNKHSEQTKQWRTKQTTNKQQTNKQTNKQTNNKTKTTTRKQQTTKTNNKQHDTSGLNVRPCIISSIN